MGIGSIDTVDKTHHGSGCWRSGEAGNMFQLPLLYSSGDILYAYDIPAKRVLRVDVFNEDLLEQLEVLGIEGDAIPREGVLDREVVERVERRCHPVPLVR